MSKKKSLQLIVNAGSATYKYTLFEGTEKILYALYQKEGEKSFTLTMQRGKKTRTEKINKREFENSLKDLLSRKESQKHLRRHALEALAFRYVHGGSFFRSQTRVTPSVLKKLKLLDELAPLHNPFARRLVKQSQQLLPGVKKFLLFDTAFHSTIPEVNWRYALPRKLSDKHRLRRYGFHGIVFSSIVRQLQEKKKLPKRLIICHLGSGCSITAVKDGKSVDTSMGFTPLEGVVMGTRAGDIDPGLLLHIQQLLRLRPQELLNILNNKSGLKGLAGTSDMREILNGARRNNTQAQIAIEIFCSSVAKRVASYVVSLGGLNRIVFSGGIGENAPLIRQRICEYLKPLKVQISEKKNKTAQAGKDFQTSFSKIKLCWLEANEASEMNRIVSRQKES